MAKSSNTRSGSKRRSPRTALERAVDDRHVRPLVEDQLSYLLFELERVITQSTVKWSPELVAGVESRLEDLVEAVRRIAVR